ncbi:MAG: hypothetical protein ACLVKO_01750 [Dysgonomonas sp.]
MKGSCIIDGIDIADLGMFILRGGDYDFLSFPERKEPEQNDWHELDGVDADLSEIYFKEKKVTVRFYIKANTGYEMLSNLNTFLELISAPGYRQLYSREFGKTFLLRYVSCPAFTHTGGMYKAGTKRAEISVEFSMDNPLQIFIGSANLIPRRGRSAKSYVTINERDLADFGIIVNECYNTVLRFASVKQPLTRSISNINGLMVYPPAQRVFEAKQTVIECTMTANNREDFYYNYEALFNNLTIKAAIPLTTFAFDDMACYYSSMSGFQKLRPFGSRVLVRFVLTLVNMSPGLIEFILGMEDGFAAITETDDYFIEV